MDPWWWMESSAISASRSRCRTTGHSKRWSIVTHSSGIHSFPGRWSGPANHGFGFSIPSVTLWDPCSPCSRDWSAGGTSEPPIDADGSPRGRRPSKTPRSRRWRSSDEPDSAIASSSRSFDRSSGLPEASGGAGASESFRRLHGGPEIITNNSNTDGCYEAP